MTIPSRATRAVAAEAWIRQQKAVAILRMDDASRVVEVCRILATHGLTAIEITADRAHALRSIRDVKQALGDEVLLGAGTVLDARTAAAAAAAGAEFCVAPNLDTEVVAACADVDVLAIPGVLTPTEIASAHQLGLSLLKLFPCAGMSAHFLAALRGPFPGIGFVATGGIDLSNASSWIEAGAAAVGLGSALVGRDGAVDHLGERARSFRSRITRAALTPETANISQRSRPDGERERGTGQ